MSKWGKVAKTLGEKGEEENMEQEEEVPIYTIETAPDPKFRFKLMRPQAYFEGRRADFQDTSTETRDEMMPDPETRRKYIICQPFHQASGNHTPMAHSDMNTTTTKMEESSINHVEGGWPEHVKPELIEHRNKFIRQTCKEDMFKWTTSRLMKNMEKVLKQNNTMDIEEVYFPDLDDTGSVQSLDVKTLARFKDFSGHRRPVSCISWKKCAEPCVVLAHCSTEFLGMYGESCRDAYLFDMQQANSPLVTLGSPDHITTVDCNDKTPDIIGAGCYTGQVCFWDTRQPCTMPAGVSEFTTSHCDAVYFSRWIGKTGTEFFTGAADGFVKWWDIRMFSNPVREYQVETAGEGVKNPGINCLSFEPTIPSKFMVGTEQGGVVVCRMQAKAGTNDWILADFETCHQGKVMAVDRNPFYPKNFLTVSLKCVKK